MTYLGRNTMNTNKLKHDVTYALNFLNMNARLIVANNSRYKINRLIEIAYRSYTEREYATSFQIMNDDMVQHYGQPIGSYVVKAGSYARVPTAEAAQIKQAIKREMMARLMPSVEV